MPEPMMDETQDEFMKRCIPMVQEDGTADSNDMAVAICSSMWEHRGEKASVTKTEKDGQHPADHYLVVEDPKSPSTWHLRVRDAKGNPDHTLMGAAWAALHEGYRGNKYEGPKKGEAISKLTALYRSEKLPLPGKDYGSPEQKIQYSAPLQVAEFKRSGDDWEVSGYVSTFNNVDYGNDIVRPGAFAKTLDGGPKVRFLLHHDPRLVLGVPKSLKEDSKGLLGRFKISKTHLGEETRQLIEDGALDSFSIGYSAEEYEHDKKAGIRYLDSVILYEASMVSMPMNPEATVTGWKDYLPILGIRDEMTLAEKIHAYSEGLNQLLNDLRGPAGHAERPLSETKRQELTELLAMFAGLDAVRTDIQSVLTAAPVKPVSQKLTSYQLAEARKRLAHIIKE